ncbi:AraC family transcriptional regulator [Flavobacterium aquiphilum]|uniref:AraC family transcriptional regulator n=1 Tax=Flavobacterium aquiphilum TaxID=3003261 RepID=UPI0024813E9A|nr:AraC family transcriptional regulator [Flavobacterium aquiphilum]
MPYKNINNSVNYSITSHEDELWGLTITTVGHQNINEKQQYPPEKHPLGYYFNVGKGRVLNEYQLLYITNGNGVFTYGNSKESYFITEGKMFFLMPGVWHTYKPMENTGWNEYWIGFKGKMIERIVREGFFLNKPPVFHIGMNEEIIDLYYKAIEIAQEERAGFQQALCGIVMNILGLMYYRDKTRDFEDEELINKINKAKVMMREDIYRNVTAEEIARNLGISYSGFRRAFKELTGTSPSKYMLELKLNEAKLLLYSTNLPIKEISYSLQFENPDYFPIFFKKRTGKTPSEYRNFVCSSNIEQNQESCSLV